MWLEWKLKGLRRKHWEEGTWESKEGGSREFGEFREGGKRLCYVEERFSAMRNEQLTLKPAGRW